MMNRVKRGFFSGLVASGAAGVIALVFRLTSGALTIPELLIDWVTSLMPLDLFLLAVGTLGGWAKSLLVIALAVILFALGGVGGILWLWLQRKSSWLSLSGQWWAGMGLGVVFWLVAMVTVLPASGRGFFGLLLQPWPITMALAWLISSLAYTLMLVALLPERKTPAPILPRTADATRRLLVKRLTYILGGLVVAAGVGGGLWKLISSLTRRTEPPQFKTELPPEITPNEDFYTVSKNFIDPVVKAESWTLEVTGEVEKPLTLNSEQLKQLPATIQYLTLECISNEVGGGLIGNALWKGVRLRELLSQARVKNPARKVVLHGVDDYTDSIQLGKALEMGTLLAYEMNGEPLPDEHGFPVRLLVPGIYGMKNVKWLTEIELVDYDYKGYWQERGWSDEAVIKTWSRIYVPKSWIDYKLGELDKVGGTAFTGDRGISLVEVSTDEGQTWQPAQVKGALSPYTWVLWVYNWQPPAPGRHVLQVRATDGQGNLQSRQLAEPLPDGASGYHTVAVKIITS